MGGFRRHLKNEDGNLKLSAVNAHNARGLRRRVAGSPSSGLQPAEKSADKRHALLECLP